MLIGWYIRARWFLILPFIPGFVLGVMAGLAFIGHPAGCAPSSPRQTAAMPAPVPVDPYFLTRMDCRRFPSVARSNPTCHALGEAPR
jgi:hypothetical protein